MKFTKRQFLAATTGALSGLASPFQLNIARAGDGFIDIVAQETEIKLHPSVPTSNLWTYNGLNPGQEIRVKQGERVKVRFTNKLSEPTSIHWHGIRIANNMDGVSGLTQDAVEPNKTFEYDFIAPDAGTYWYHAHNKSWNQVARGLYGSLIVEEPYPAFKPENDVTLIIDDWRLNQDGTLDTDSIGSLMDWTHGGRLGNYITVNGEYLPTIKFKSGQASRLRLINVANARVFAIDPNKFDATVIAYDGQPLPTPIKLPYQPLLLGPSQRVDLQMIPSQPGTYSFEDLSNDKPYEFAKFEVEEAIEVISTPIILKSNKLPEPDLNSAKTFALKMTGGAMGSIGDVSYNGKPMNMDDFRTTKQAWAFNGVANLAKDPFFDVQRGQTVLIEITNATVFLHAMHIHGHHFRVIDRSDSTVDEGRPWRDTFMIGQEQTTKIAFVADNPGKWLLHCHMLEHAAAGMNTWFNVG